MNASDRLNTCKSRGSGVVAIRLPATGARVRDTCATCPSPGDNPRKRGLIPHNIRLSHDNFIKTPVVTDGHAGH